MPSIQTCSFALALGQDRLNFLSCQFRIYPRLSGLQVWLTLCERSLPVSVSIPYLSPKILEDLQAVGSICGSANVQIGHHLGVSKPLVAILITVSHSVFPLGQPCIIEFKTCLLQIANRCLILLHFKTYAGNVDITKFLFQFFVFV